MFIVEELLPVGAECGAAVNIEHLVGVALVGHVQAVDVVLLPSGWGGVTAPAVGDAGVGVGHLAIDPELSHGGGRAVVGRGRNILGGGLLIVVLPRGVGGFRGCLGPFRAFLVLFRWGVGGATGFLLRGGVLLLLGPGETDRVRADEG